MKILDLSRHCIINEIVFQVDKGSDRNEVNYGQNLFEIGSAKISCSDCSCIYAPKHYQNDGESIDQLNLNIFIGQAVVIDLRDKKCCSIIDKNDLQLYEDQIKKTRRILFCTEWDSNRAGSGFCHTSFPSLSNEAADYLISAGIQMIGADCPLDETIQKMFAGKSIGIVEHLTNLESLIGKSFTFSAAPQFIHNADGAPVRAYALLDES